MIVQKKNVCLFIVIFICCLSQMTYSQTVAATTGTMSIGKADGVAIWLHPTDPSQSIIIGADPTKGLGTFNLDGSLIEMVNFGFSGAGEVDVRYNFPIDGKSVSLIASAHENKNEMRFFTVDPETRLLKEITGNKINLGINAYGSCLYHSKTTGKFYSIITSREGLIEQWEIFDNGNGKIDGKLVRELNILPEPQGQLSPKIEACVADDELAWLYICQEKECMIWKYGAEPEDGGRRKLVDNAEIVDGDNVEGLAIYHIGRESGYIIASIQGSWKYKVYDREDNNRYIGIFNIVAADSSGIIEAHDCIEVTNINLGPGFPNGLMVTQNSKNACGAHWQLIPWQSIANELRIRVDLSYDPRVANKR